MFKKLTATVALAAIFVCSANTYAVDFEFVGKRQDVLKIHSSEVGTERFELSISGGVLTIDHSFNKQSTQTHLSANLLVSIVFEGDDDRDEFFNWTEKRLVAFGNAGNDEIWGGSAGDSISGGPGKDYLFGRGGDDDLFPGLDWNEGTIDGGDGYDYAEVNTVELHVMFYVYRYIPNYDRAPRDIEVLDQKDVPMSIDEFLAIQ
ncbi:calcium-binding protein [Planctomycetes bacterium K23_9]